MNSVALPASAPSTVLDAESDLLRRAARGQAEAFEELYRRHGQPAWRLAQAVAPDRESAVDAFGEGFSRALRAQRHLRREPSGRRSFRPQVLSAIYRAAVSHAYERTASPARSAVADSAEAALAHAAFRSLPERWRAAVWLSEVENLDAERVALVLGVSVAVANQLMARGRRGLLGRFSQAHREPPEHLGSVLRPLALALPANLGELTRARLNEFHKERGPVMAPVAGWLEDRAIRPMSVAVGALFGLGLIGLGVVPQASPIRGSLGASGGGNLRGAVPVHTCHGLPCLPSGIALDSVGGFPSFPTSGGFGDSSGGSAGPVAAAAGGSGSGSLNPLNPTGTQPVLGTPIQPTGGTPLPTLPANPLPVTVPTSPLTTPGTLPPPSGSSGTTIPLGPAGNVSSTGTQTQVNLLPSGTSSSVSGTVSPTCGGLTVLGTTTGTCTTGTTSAPLGGL